MYTVPQLVIAFMFCVNATMAINYTVRFFRDTKPKEAMNYLIYWVTLSSAIWSIGMGMMSLQSNDTYANNWRTFGIVGTFMFMMSIQKIMCVLSELPKSVQRVINLVAYSGVIVFLLYLTPGQTVYVHNEIGTTFYFNRNWINTVYSSYFTIVSVNILLVTIYIIRHHTLRQVRIASKRFFVVELLIWIGAITDMIMPSFGFVAFPGSAITHFWGVCVFWYAIHEMYSFKITVANMSEYVYYSLGTPVLVFNTDYRLEIANDAAASLFGKEMSSIHLYGSHIDALFDTDDSIFDFEEKTKVVKAVARANHISCEIAISKIKTKYKDVIGYILLVNDLTEHEMVIQKLEQAKLAADSANMSKSLFLANMSHEIRTPMNAILGYSQLALSEKLDSRAQSYFSEIKHSGEVLLSIINEILDISKIELGKQELHYTNYKPARIYRDVEMITKVQANKKGLEFKVSIDPQIPNELHGDKDKVREILLNLLSNAVKYTNKGHICFQAKLIGRENDNCTIEYKVSDSGIGIKKEDLPGVFDKFRRLDSALNSKTEGTGLGLSITKGLVELMGGTISVESVVDSGSEFTVILSEKIVDDNPIVLLTDIDNVSENKTTITPANFKVANNLHFLIVDDNEVNLRITSLLLKSHNISSDVAASGKEAIEKCRKTAYDVVLMDQMMPEMDGIEAMQYIRGLAGYEFGSSQKIVALTANVIEGVAESLIAQGFDAFLGKPMDFSEFLATMNEILPEDKWQPVSL